MIKYVQITFRNFWVGCCRFCRLFFYFSIFGKNSDSPIWYRKSGKNLIFIYNNFGAARECVEWAKDIFGYDGKIVREPWLTRNYKVILRQPKAALDRTALGI